MCGGKISSFHYWGLPDRLGRRMPEAQKRLSDSFLLIHRNLGTWKVPRNFWFPSPSLRSFPELPPCPAQTVLVNIYNWSSSRGPPQDSIHYLITKTAVTVKRNKEISPVSRGTLETPRQIRLVKHSRIHILDEVPRLKLKSSLGV